VYHALSIRQPWANLICAGQKTVEVRSWQTDYRGPLVICAGLSVDSQAAIVHDVDIQPIGSTICLVQLVDIRPLQRSDTKAAMVPPEFHTTGQFAWCLARPRPLIPRPVRGALGIFGVSDSVVVPA
jgi:ASCH domain-containing protein